MQDANEMECLIFETAIRNIVLGKVTKSGVSEANNKLIINIFLTVGSYRLQPHRNRVNPKVSGGGQKVPPLRIIRTESLLLIMY